MFTQLQEIKANNLIKGFYIDSPLNRKLGRVGKEYDIKEEEIELKPVFKNYYDKRIDNKLNEILNRDSENIKNFSKFYAAFEKEIDEKKLNPLKVLIDLCGGFMSDDIFIKQFDIIKIDSISLNINIKTDKFVVGRKIDLINKELGPGLIDVKDVNKPEKGLGYKMFYNEIETAYNLGIKNFRINAGGNASTKFNNEKKDQLNGYEFWGKLGFEIDNDKWIGNREYVYKESPSQIKFKDVLSESKYKDCNSILELYSKEGGYDFWVKNGSSLHMNFNLSHSKDNKQIQILKKYNQEYVKRFGTN